MVGYRSRAQYRRDELNEAVPYSQSFGEGPRRCQVADPDGWDVAHKWAKVNALRQV